MERNHYHPLNPSKICCPEHAYELCSIYRQQSRHAEAVSCLVSLYDSVDTKFLLDNQPESVKHKRSLSLWANSYSVQQVKLQDYTTALALLECSELLLSNQPEDPESVGLLSSTFVNKAMCCSHLGDIDGACMVLERAAVLDRQAKDTIGSLITRINKSSMLFNLGSFQESYNCAKEVASVLDPKVSTMMRSNSDPDLASSQKFIDLLSLYLIAQMNILAAIEKGGEKNASGLESLRTPAVALATRFFGETHFFTLKLKRSTLTSKRDFRIRTRKGRSWGSDSCDQSSQDGFGKVAFEDGKTYISQFDDASASNHQNFIEDEQVKTLVVQTPKNERPTSNRPSKTQLVVDVEPPLYRDVKGAGTTEAKNVSLNIVHKRTSSKEVPSIKIPAKQDVDSQIAAKTASAKPTSVKPAAVKPLKVIRLSNSKLPQIPFRPCWNSCLKFVKQRKFEIKDYSFLLDPHLGYVNVPADTQVSKLTSFGTETYVLTCGVTVNSGSLFLVITAELVNSTNSYITPESIQFTELSSIINYLAVRDILPSNVPVKFINNFEKFSEYFLLPFIRVTNIEDGHKKIELWSQPNNLLQPDIVRLFLDRSCKVSVYQVTLKTLRLVLNEVGDDENIDSNVYVDLVLDDEAAGLLLKEYEAKYYTPSCLPSLKPLDVSFMKQLDPFITELELYVKDCMHLNATFNQVVKSKLLFKVRATITGSTLEKTLWTIRDLRKQQIWKIRAKSLAASNSSGRKNRCEAILNYPYSALLQNYGVNIDRLEQSERLVFAHYTLNGMRLEQHADDEACSSESLIVPTNVQNVITKRSMKTTDYKVPVTLSLIGQGAMLLGVKATLLDVSQGLDVGCFFPVFGDIFKGKEVTPPTKKKRRFEVMDALLSEAVSGSNVADLLDSESGWGHLLHCVQIESGKLFVRDLIGRKAYLDSLENVILHYK